MTTKAGNCVTNPTFERQRSNNRLRLSGFHPQNAASWDRVFRVLPMIYIAPNLTKVIVLTALFAPAISGQTFDSSGNPVLNGTYFVREVMFSNLNVIGHATTAQSAIGTVTFDGNGNYNFNGQVMTNGGSAPSTMSISGTYKCSSNQLLKIQSLFHAIDSMDDLNSAYGGVGAAGPNAFVASATEGQNYDLLIAIPVSSNNNSLSGSYTAAYLGVPQNDSNSSRSATFTLTADGKGGFGNVSVGGSAANLGNTPNTQTNSGVTYTFAGNGTGSIDFGPVSSSQIVGGNQMFAVSADGNLLLGGSPNDFDILIALRALPASAPTTVYQGTYFLAGIWDSVKTATTTNYVAGVYGSTTATASGVALWHWRYNESTPGAPSSPFDYTFSESVANSGITVGANGQAAFFLAGQGFYQLVLELQAPSFSGSGVFLDPVGIVNTASYSPITTPIAPLEMISLYGSGLSPVTISANGYPLPTTLGKTQVMMNGQPAPLVYVSPTFIVAVVPGAIQPQVGQQDNGQWTKVQVINNGTASNPSMVRVAETSPGVFTASENGIGEAAIRHSDYSLVTSQSPATAGETVLIYVTGLGSVAPQPADGEPASGLTTVNKTAYVGIDGQYVLPTFEGLAPSFAGLYQMNVVVPQTADSGDVPLSIVITSVGANSSATIPVTGTAGSNAAVKPNRAHKAKDVPRLPR